jgi:hypothetical protein
MSIDKLSIEIEVLFHEDAALTSGFFAGGTGLSASAPLPRVAVHRRDRRIADGRCRTETNHDGQKGRWTQAWLFRPC